MTLFISDLQVSGLTDHPKITGLAGELTALSHEGLKMRATFISGKFYFCGHGGHSMARMVIKPKTE
jgi:hypothetical protein